SMRRVSIVVDLLHPTEGRRRCSPAASRSPTSSAPTALHRPAQPRPHPSRHTASPVILRRPAGTIVHSDRGSQFRSRKFVEALHANGLSGSMGRVGACRDNAAMESFFALLQRNVLDRHRWATTTSSRLAII